MKFRGTRVLLLTHGWLCVWLLSSNCLLVLPVGHGFSMSSSFQGLSRRSSINSLSLSSGTRDVSNISCMPRYFKLSPSQLFALGDNEQDRSESSSSPLQNESNNNSTTSSSHGENKTTNSAATASIPATTLSFLPSYKQLIIFTATTILIWISEPLLSLVDTTIVSVTARSPQSASSVVVQIAALGPATTLYDSAVYMTYFLAIATTNLISPALARKDWKQLRRSTSHFMGLALVFGSLVTTICFTMGRNIIQGIVGATTSPQHHQIVQFATQYAWIRAMVAPFAVVDFCAQSFCLACLDTKTPALAVAVASLVNIVGDLVLSPAYGIQGAAIATALATVSSCAILVRQVRRKTNEWKILQENEEYLGTTSAQSEPSPHDAVGNPPTRPTTRVVNGAIEFLDPPNDNAGKEETSSNVKMKKQAKAIFSKAMINRPASTDIPFFSLPDRQSLVDLLGLAGPIFFIMMLKIACYSLMTVQATRFGIIPLAAHNIMMRFFFFFACFGDSLSQASQTFFPQTTLKTQLLKRLLYLSAGVGLTISLGSHVILTRLGGYLIKETAILQTMATYAPYMASALFVHPLIMLMEGTILARRDLMVLMGMYVGTMVVHCGWVLNGATNLSGLWQAFLGFQCLRLIQFTSRVVWKTRRSRTVDSGHAIQNYL